jgi:stress-induced morphogen
MVYALLDDEFKNGLHAINIITKTPEEFSKSKGT